MCEFFITITFYYTIKKRGKKRKKDGRWGKMKFSARIYVHTT